MNNNRGFTLVELLMVVAMIGVLATIGIPTYQRMVQRAKKSEAKTMLAGIFTAESGFQAEYGTFGNRLDRIGFGAVAGTQTYIVGFPLANCATDVIAPAIGTAPGAFLNNVYPGYYNVATVAQESRVLPVRNQPTACDPGAIGVNGDTFTATATGALATNPAGNVLATLGDLDCWRIDQNRVLSNLNDGVQ